MLGAIAGDIIGSRFERSPIKTKEFPLFTAQNHFTDDTVLTVAVAEAILTMDSYQHTLHRYGNRYPHAGYGASFRAWLTQHDPHPYGSWGNGSAMRVAPVGLAFDNEEEVLAEAKKSACVTHDHPEGIRGAQAIAWAVFAARTGGDKPFIREEITARFGYDLGCTLADIRPGYRFDVSCTGSVPQALISFLEADDWQDAVRNAVSLGGDSDTLACMAGAVAEAFWGGVPAAVYAQMRRYLPTDFQKTIETFYARFTLPVYSREDG
jgi:ADP-ribosylglycohydrolase